MARKFLPRLSQADVEALMRAHQAAQAADRLLQGTNWAAAPACRILVGTTDSVICALWNKVERAIKAGAAAESTEKPQDVPADSSAAAGTGELENAPPGEPKA